jgi:hypothetical protein
LFLAFAAPVAGEIVVVQNDSIMDFGSATIQAGFVAGERGAAWLTTPCEGDLIAVRILWLDFLSSGSQTLGDTITVSAAGGFPVPGAALAELVAPLLTEGFFNEFVIDPPIPMQAAQPFVVDFKFLSTPPPLGPSLVTDIDGCQPVKNGIFAIPPSAWLDLCPLGVTGDLAIRAVLSCEAVIFEDGFESGDTSAWSSTVPLVGGAARPTFPVLQVDPDLPPFWRHPQPNR